MSEHTNDEPQGPTSEDPAGDAAHAMPEESWGAGWWAPPATGGEPAAPYGQPEPTAQWGQPEPTAQWGQGQPAAPPYGQGQGQAPPPWGHGEPAAPYGQGQGQSAPPWGHGEPAAPYGQGPAGAPPHAGPFGPAHDPSAPPPAPYGHWAGTPGHGGWGGNWGWVPPGAGWPDPHGGATAGRRRHPVVLALAALFTAIAVLIGVGIGYSVWSSGSAAPSSATPLLPAHGGGGATTATPGTTAATTGTTGGKVSRASGSPSNISSIAAKVDPGLVDINTVLSYQTAEAAGTGMVLTSTGKVLTNNHVIEGSTSIHVTDLGNGKTYAASVVGYDRTSDVAVIQLKGASNLKTVTFGNSSSVSVGEAVVGIGNAGGTGGSPSTAGGSITALNQAITASDQGSSTTEHLTGLIQSNANIQPGDSGGPLVDTAGKVIGMDTAASVAQGFTFNGAATGQGYSIPINTALGIARQIEAGKASSVVHLGATPFLGVEVAPASAATRAGTVGRGFGSSTPTATPGATTTRGGAVQGALVEGLISGAPATSAGIVKGDVITALGGQPVTSPNALTKAIEQHHPGDSVKVTWTTPAGATQSATVTLAGGPAG